MATPKKFPKSKHFSVFRTAAEEDSNAKSRDSEAGRSQMSATCGRIVRTPGKEKPYKVMLEHEEGGETEHPVSTMKEGEALIKRETPRPAKRDTARDHERS
jgi:hypothetical protein